MGYDVVRKQGVLKLVIGHQCFAIGPTYEDYIDEHGFSGHEAALEWWERQIRTAMDRITKETTALNEETK